MLKSSKTQHTGTFILQIDLWSAECYSPDDVYIAIMGVTGAGKSTFISKCCQKAEKGIGHGLKSRELKKIIRAVFGA